MPRRSPTPCWPPSPRVGFDFLVANFANADMVGHTGHFAATVAAVEALDGAVGRVAQAVLALDAAEPDGGALLCITADHGNADEMTDVAGHPVDGPFAKRSAAAAGRRAVCVARGCGTACSPTWRRRCSRGPAWSRRVGMTGRDLLEPPAAG